VTLAHSLAPLRHRRFAWYFAARTVSHAGSAMVTVALAFAVLHITGSTVALGEVIAARVAATLVFLLVGGVTGDRLPRVVVIQTCHVISALTQGLAAYLVISGRATVPTILALEAINGAVTAFTMPALIGMVPQLVTTPELQSANAVLALSKSTLDVVGPAVAGILVASVGPGWALAADAMTYALAVIFLVPVRLSRSESVGSNRSMVADLREGWAEFTERSWVWVVVLVFMVLNGIHLGAMGVIGPTVATQRSELGSDGWGYVMSAIALGVVLGTLVMMRYRPRFPLRAGLLGVSLLAPTILVLGVSPQTWLLVVLGVVAGLGVQIFEVSWTTSLQENIPQDRLSRVASYDSFGSFVAMPIGTLLYGYLGAHVQTRPLLAISAGIFALVSLAALMLPSVRSLTRTTA
jgi:MFS family permease